MKKVMKKSKKEDLSRVKRTHPKIIITAITAIVCVILALFNHWIWILPAVLLWWINKRSIKKHFGV